MSSAKFAGNRWCILRTSGGKTLPLATSLAAAGFETWTPRQVLKRPVPGSKPGLNGRRPMAEVSTPILPTFVFARAVDLDMLLRVSNDQASKHPTFSVFRHGGRAPLIAHGEVAGLQEAEHAAEAFIQALRDADTREEQRKIRSAAMKTDRERRKALKREVRHFARGQTVSLTEADAFAGVSLVIEEGDGHSALMMFGSMRMKIESWRLLPNELQPSRP